MVAYEDLLLRFDELLTLAMDPAFEGASNFLTAGPTTTPPPTGPQPRPRPKIRPLGLLQTDHRYNWITARAAASIASTESSTTTPSPSVTSTASSSVASSSSADSSLSRGSNNFELDGSDDSGSKKNWPDDYTIKEIHEGLLAMRNKGRARKGSGIKVCHRFEEAFPDAER